MHALLSRGLTNQNGSCFIQKGTPVIDGMIIYQATQSKEISPADPCSIIHLYIQEEGEFLDEKMYCSASRGERRCVSYILPVGSLIVVHHTTLLCISPTYQMNAWHDLCSNMFFFPSQSCASLCNIIAIKFVATTD